MGKGSQVRALISPLLVTWRRNMARETQALVPAGKPTLTSGWCGDDRQRHCGDQEDLDGGGGADQPDLATPTWHLWRVRQVKTGCTLWYTVDNHQGYHYHTTKMLLYDENVFLVCRPPDGVPVSVSEWFLGSFVLMQCLSNSSNSHKYKEGNTVHQPPAQGSERKRERVQMMASLQ